jgi:NAD+ kinase
MLSRLHFIILMKCEMTVEMLISLGGDGTILEAVTFIRESETPILGINFGRLGFLANVGREQIEQALEIVAKGKYIIDKRTIIEITSNKPLFGSSAICIE